MKGPQHTTPTPTHSEVTGNLLDEITFHAQEMRDDSDWEELRKLRVDLALLLASLIQGDY